MLSSTQRIRDAYEAFEERDLESLRDFWHEDAIYVNPPYAMEAGTREGRDAVVEIWNGLHSLFEYDEVEVLEISEGPGGVLVRRALPAAAARRAEHPWTFRWPTSSRSATAAWRALPGTAPATRPPKRPGSPRSSRSPRR